MKGKIDSLRQEARYSVSADAQGKTIRYGWFEAPSYSEISYVSPDEATFAKAGELAKKYHSDSSIEELLESFASPTWKEIMHPSLVLFGFDQDGALSREIFRKIGERNPRIRDRYDDGRLCKRPDGTSWIEILDTANGMRFFAYHESEDGQWIRDTYSIESNGVAKFQFHTTQEQDTAYNADIERADADESTKRPNLEEYSIAAPSLVYDPLNKMGTVRNAVGRILDAVRL